MPRSRMIIESSRFRELAERAPMKAAAAVGESALDLEGAIKDGITAVKAVKSGHMRRTTQALHEPGDLAADVVTQAEYWKHVNDGTHKMAARPFVEPAVDLVQPRHNARVAKALEP